MEKILIYGFFETVRILAADRFETVTISVAGRYSEMNFLKISTNSFL
jgi:hypothetical protein